MVMWLIQLVLAGAAFGVMWGPLGVGKLVRNLLRDEEAEIQAKIAEAEDKLAEITADPDPDETTAMLKAHWEQEIRSLRRQIERL